MPALIQRYFLFLLLLLPCTLPSSAEAVYAPSKQAHQRRTQPARTKYRLALRKPTRIQQSQKDINTSLYLTFALIFLLPLLVISGFTIALLSVELIGWLALGVGLIGLGNLATIIAGLLAGRSRTYSTNALTTGVWVLFGINLLGGLVALALSITMVAALGLGLSFFFLCWGALIWRQRQAFRRGSRIPPRNAELERG